MYLSCEFDHTRVTGLKTFWNESLWLEIKDIYLIGLFHSPWTADAIFFNSINKNIENVRKGAKIGNRYNQESH